MGRSFVSNNFSRRKFILLAASFFISTIAWLGAYEFFSSNMTNWQKNRPIDIRNESGLTRAKVYIDSTTAAGIVFCVSAAILAVIDKKSSKRQKK